MQSIEHKESLSYRLLNAVEENKEDMNDNLYISLCNILSEIYKDEQEKDTFYQIKILYTCPRVTGSRIFDIDLVQTEKIVKLSIEEYNLICKDLEDNPFSRPEKISSIESLNDEIFFRYKDEASEINEGDSEIFIFKSAVIIGIRNA